MKDLVFLMPIKINSTRLKNKSIKNLLGRPLFCWSLETLDKLDVPIYVFSSDCELLKKKIDFDSKNIFFLDRDKRFDHDDVLGIQIYKEFRKIIPADNSKNMVVFGEIDIFFNEGVGILLTNIKAVKIVR